MRKSATDLINELRLYKTVTDVENAPFQAGIKLHEAAQMIQNLLEIIENAEMCEGIDFMPA